MNLLDRAAKEKRINDLLANPIEAASKIESLQRELAQARALKDLIMHLYSELDKKK